MDFFEMDFSKLFLEKHGKKIFDDIVDKIKIENNNTCDLEYVSIVFKIAFLDFFKLKDSDIQSLINDIYTNQQINVNRILIIHNESISIIKNYLKDTIEKE